MTGAGPARPDVIRRRRVALGSVAALALVVGAIIGAAGGSSDDSGAGPVADAAPQCPEEVAASPARLAGQMVIARMEAIATDSLRRRLAHG